MLDNNGNEVFTEQPIDSLIINGYKIFGKYVNESRHLPHLRDGLKPVYRRLIQTAFEAPDRKLKTATITGECIAFYHPHGESIRDVAPELVHMGIFEGQGSFGKNLLTGEKLRAASPRYTEVKLNSTIRAQLSKLLPYVPRTPAYSYGHEEYEYIPTPIPTMLITSTLGIGFGIGTRIPAFTIKSLYEAYVNDDFTLLKPNYGYELDINDKSNYNGLKSLWETGYGSLTYKIPIEDTWVEGEHGYMISCNPVIFKPTLTKLREWESYGWVNIMDLTDKVPKLFISRVKRCRSIDDEDILKELKKVCSKKRGYCCNIFDGNIAGAIGIKAWIDYTFKQYVAIYEDYIKDNINRLDFDWILWRDFPRAAQLITDVNEDKSPKYTYEEIVKIINDENLYRKGEKFRSEYKEFTIEHINTIGRKSLNTLRTADASTKIKEIEKAIQDFKNISIDNEIKAYVDSYSINVA